MSRAFFYAVIISSVTLLPGCGIFGDSKDGGTAGVESTGGDTFGAGSGSGFSGHPLDNPEGELAGRIILFDFDRFEVKPEWHAMVRAHAGYLQQNPSARVRLEGHADERGTREYNQALGERRSNAVSEMVAALGASGQISTLSYGEEKPVTECHDESCWSQNRRVEIIYTAR